MRLIIVLVVVGLVGCSSVDEAQHVHDMPYTRTAEDLRRSTEACLRLVREAYANDSDPRNYRMRVCGMPQDNCTLDPPSAPMAGCDDCAAACWSWCRFNLRVADIPCGVQCSWRCKDR